MTREFDSFDAIQTANFGFVVTLADAETAEKFAYKTGIEDAIKEVLEIIDSEAWSYCDYIIKHENGNSDKQVAASLLSENIREAVLSLKGGEQE